MFAVSIRKMSSYTLHYFAGRGRAEAVRIAFAYGGIDFVDARLPGPALFAAKAEGKVHCPFEQFPVLEVDGKPLAQSGAILRYVSKMAGLVPADAFEAALAESVADQMGDFGAAVYQAVYFATDKEAGMKDFIAKIDKLLKGVSAYLGEKEYFFGGVPSIADIAVFTSIEMATKFGVPAEHFPANLVALTARMAEHPKLKGYLAKRAEVEAAESA